MGEKSTLSKLKPSFLVDFRYAIVGGVLAMAITIVGSLAVGDVSGSEARLLLESMFPTTRFLCSAVMTGSATILALMLTLLSLSYNLITDAEGQLRTVHFKRVKQIALIDSITFVGSTMLLLFHSIPLEKSDQVPNAWFDTVYYMLLSATALIGGLLVTIVLMLYHTVSDMIKTLGPGDTDALLVSQEKKQEA